MASSDMVSKRFDAIRKRINQETEGGKQQETEALQRRFASGGMLGSGASIKAENQARANLDLQKQQAMEGVEAQELGERQRLQETQEMRDFSKSERLGSQDFGAAQANLMRQFQTGERVGGQDFAAGQANLMRQFQTGERVGGQEFGAAQADLMRKFQTSERMGSQKFAQSERLGSQGFSKEMQRKQNDFQYKLFNKQFKEQTRQWEEQFKEDKDINAFNKMMAEKQFNKPGMLDMLRNPLGFFSGPGSMLEGMQGGGWMDMAKNTAIGSLTGGLGSGLMGGGSIGGFRW
jgi:hypothetical protein